MVTLVVIWLFLTDKKDALVNRHPGCSSTDERSESCTVKDDPVLNSNAVRNRLLVLAPVNTTDEPFHAVMY